MTAYLCVISHRFYGAILGRNKRRGSLLQKSLHFEEPTGEKDLKEKGETRAFRLIEVVDL